MNRFERIIIGLVMCGGSMTYLWASHAGPGILDNVRLAAISGSSKCEKCVYLISANCEPNADFSYTCVQKMPEAEDYSCATGEVGKLCLKNKCDDIPVYYCNSDGATEEDYCDPEARTGITCGQTTKKQCENVTPPGLSPKCLCASETQVDCDGPVAWSSCQ